MRTARARRAGRFSRSRIIASAGGGGLPARTTAPTFREALVRSSATWPYDSAGLTGDVGVHMLITAGTSGTAQVASMTGQTEEVETQSGTSQGTVWGLGYGLTAGYRVLPADVNSDLTLSATPGTVNNLGGENVIFSGVDGTPSLQHLAAFGDDGVPAGWGVTANVVTFPAVDVPTGYTAVYQFIVNNAISGFTWAVATERTDSQSFAGLGYGFCQATLNGASDGVGVTLTRTGIQTSIEGRGAYAAVWLVPGT